MTSGINRGFPPWGMKVSPRGLPPQVFGGPGAPLLRRPTGEPCSTPFPPGKTPRTPGAGLQRSPRLLGGKGGKKRVFSPFSIRGPPIRGSRAAASETLSPGGPRQDKPPGPRRGGGLFSPPPGVWTQRAGLFPQGKQTKDRLWTKGATPQISFWRQGTPHEFHQRGPFGTGGGTEVRHIF